MHKTFRITKRLPPFDPASFAAASLNSKRFWGHLWILDWVWRLIKYRTPSSKAPSSISTPYQIVHPSPQELPISEIELEFNGKTARIS